MGNGLRPTRSKRQLALRLELLRQGPGGENFDGDIGSTAHRVRPLRLFHLERSGFLKSYESAGINQLLRRLFAVHHEVGQNPGAPLSPNRHRAILPRPPAVEPPY